MRQLSASLGLVALAGLAACDVPTQAPIYDTQWDVPGKSTTISVNTLLPAGVTATPDNSAFKVNVSPSSTSISRQLAQDCAACAAANGLTLPKPAFSGGGTSSVALPSSVSSVTLVRDTLTLTIANGFNFDPIRPSAAARGYLVITVQNGGAIVGRDSLDGAAVALAAGSTTTRKIALNGTLTAASGLQVATSLVSPAGDPVVIDASRAITVTGSVGTLFVSSAKVNLANQVVSTTGTDIDLTGVGDQVTSRASGGSLVLGIANPFGVTGNLTLTFSGGATPFTKSIALGTGNTTPSIAFNRDELRSILGHDITVDYGGTVNGSAVTVSPGQAVSVSSRLQIAINMGKQD